MQETEKSRKDWEKNHEAIKNCYIEYIRLNHKMPTMTYVAKELNVNWSTIDRHIKDLKFTPEEHPLRVLSDEVILAIAATARKGNPQSQKLWFQVMENWAEKSKFDITTKGKALTDNWDLSELTDDELREYIRINKKIEQGSDMEGGEGPGK